MLRLKRRPCLLKRTLFVLLLGDHRHGHAGRRSELPSAGQAADLQRAEVTLQGVLQPDVSLLALLLLLGALPRPVVHLQPHHFAARTRRTSEENEKNNLAEDESVKLFAGRGVYRTQLQRGPWTQTGTEGGCCRSLSHADQPLGVAGRTGCSCCLPSHHPNPLETTKNTDFKLNCNKAFRWFSGSSNQ